MVVERVGYGAGAREIPGQPNLARLMVGRRTETVKVREGAPGDDLVCVIEASVDDMSPQIYGFFAEQALAAGALDVTCTPVQMKKGRPGILVTVLCTPEASDALASLLLEQTTTIGVRIHEARRKVLDRELVSVETPYGAARVKLALRDGKVLNVAPEYEDCRRLATEKGVPLKQVMLAAQAAWLEKAGKASEAEVPAEPAAPDAEGEKAAGA
jgi:hypothetical protein